MHYRGSKEGVNKEFIRLDAIYWWLILASVGELCPFLGLIDYY
jgi:hypothetical protein